jgi:hypothetical protein
MSLGAVWGTVRERNFVEWTHGYPNLGGAGQDRWYRLRNYFAEMSTRGTGVEPVNKKEKEVKNNGSGVR